MNILFIHPNMPGQFKHLCRKFAEDKDNTVVFITKPRPHINFPNVYKVEYKPPREPSGHTHRYITSYERAVIQGQEVWRICKKLKEDGFVPDVVVSHPGWGDCLFIREIYGNVPMLSFFEFYYRSVGADVNFDSSDSSSDDDLARIRVKNATNLFCLEQADWGISPTFWQYSLHPQEFKPKISVVHDGIDTNICKPMDDISVTLGDVTLSKKDEVITYVTRNYEPYRGFPTFMQAAEIILKNRPNAHIVSVGGDDVSYGKRPPAHTNYREIWTKKCNFSDPSRIHFMPLQGYDNFLRVLQVSSAHIYLTYPFVLSWSSMEAMSCGAAMIASDTQPVQEVIEDGKNGLLVDFFSPDEVANAVDRILDHPDRMQDMRNAARQTILDYYDLNKLVPLQMGLVKDLAKGQIPPPTAKTIDAMNEKHHAGRLKKYQEAA